MQSKENLFKKSFEASKNQSLELYSSQDSLYFKQDNESSMEHKKNTSDSNSACSKRQEIAKMDQDFIGDFKKSYIVISNDFESEITHLKNTYTNEQLKIYETDDLKIDDVHAIIQEAHVASNSIKIIAIFAFSYNHFAQNALLKILEEPPEHIIFILHISTRNKLMPTIFSRLIVFNKYKKRKLDQFPLDLRKLSVPMVYEYIHALEKENVSQEKGRTILSQILEEVIRHNIALDKVTLDRFDLSLKALYSKQSVHFALLPILLSLVKRQ